MIAGNVKMALSSLRATKWRSLLTMLGIIIGVVSVVTTVSLGEGVKHQVVNQINHLGTDLITVRPGSLAARSAGDTSGNLNFLYGYAFGPSGLSESDLKVVGETPGAAEVVPVSFLSDTVQSDEQTYNGFAIATSDGLPDVLRQSVQFGSFFSAKESNKAVAIIGHQVAEQLFQESVPIGRKIYIRGEAFVVSGIFEQADSSPLSLGFDYNASIFIPFAQGKRIAGSDLPVSQIFVRPNNPNGVSLLSSRITQRLREAHAGQTDFSVLRQDQNVTLTSDVLNLLTGLVAGVAAISLAVGGIGIMNIMLLSVTERTREIGVRKAIGATNRQILGQFLVEAAILSLVGGMIGVLLALAIDYAIRILTHLVPALSLRTILLATGVSLVVGIFFGMAPAIKAARKDPIDALRYE